MLVKLQVVTLAVLVILTSCKKPDNDQEPAVHYSAVVSFGDSLSDAGTYRVGPIKTAGGGQFTVNGIVGEIGSQPVPTYTWAQLVAAAAIGRPSCAARSGGFGSAVSNEPALGSSKCRNYAQGGSRVTDPKGVGNPVGAGFTAGPLTEPVAAQIANFAADNGSENFTGSELITVLAGPNDLFTQIDILTADAQAAGAAAFAKSIVSQLVAAIAPANQAQAQAAIAQALQTESAQTGSTPISIITAAIKAAGTFLTAAVDPTAIGKNAEAAAKDAGRVYAATTGIQKATAAMAGVGSALADAVKGMVNKGAAYIVVVNIPDVSQTPSARRSPDSQPLVLAMTQAFNTALGNALINAPEVLLVDAFSENQRQYIDPGHYDLTNVTDPACNLTFPANILDTTKNGSGSSVVCNGNNLIESDTARYLFADNVHPTPYGHKLLAQFVTKAMVLAGWL